MIDDGGRGIFRGCHWGQETRYAVLDIDATSRYYTKQKLGELISRLAAVGLRATLYQSSNSGGWHLYIPFDEKEQSQEVGQTLKRWLRAFGYEVIGGQLEVFPGGNALRLPLQPGFAWLDQNGNVIQTREELRRDEALASFLTDLETDPANWYEAKSLIESQISLYDRAIVQDAQAHEKRLNLEGFERIYSRGKIEETWEKGRKWWRHGLQENGERHNAILAVGHYLWYGDEERSICALPGTQNAEYRAHLIEAWLKKNHNGHCSHINRSDWKTVKEDIKRAAYWRREEATWVREHYPLTSRLLKRLVALYRKTGRIWSVEQFEKANQNRRLEARARIAVAICSLEDEGQQISVNEVARRAKADWRTVKKNWDLMAVVLSSDNLEETNIEIETDRNLLACSGGVISLGGLPLTEAFGSDEVGDCLEPVFVHRDTNTFSPDSNIAFQEFASNVNFTIMETPKTMAEHDLQALGNALASKNEPHGNSLRVVADNISPLGKISFILPYGSQRRPQLKSDLKGSDFVTRRRLCEREPGQRRPLLRLLKNRSKELAPIVLKPAYPLPGYEPNSEPPASRPSPSGSFGSLDAGALVHRYSGRAADGAAGFEHEQAARTRTKESRGPPATVS